MKHELVDNTLVTVVGGIVARCTCGWTSDPHFSSLAASADFQDHQVRAQRLGDAPIEPAYHDMMNVLAGFLDSTFNGEAKGKDKKVGFVLLVFNYNDAGAADSRCNFISNGADRRDVVTLMKEMIARFEGQPEMKGSG